MSGESIELKFLVLEPAPVQRRPTLEIGNPIFPSWYTERMSIEPGAHLTAGLGFMVRAV
jgi:hypothetical protein